MRRLPMAAAEEIKSLADENQRDPLVQFNYGVSLLCAGYGPEAAAAFRNAKWSGRNTLYEMLADEFLHPKFYQPKDGLYPVFQPLSKDDSLARGSVLQRQGKEHSAEEVFATAARAQPHNAEAHVAVAIATFDEDHPIRVISKLAGVARTFPRSQTTWFHLALVEAWFGRASTAYDDFRRAYVLAPTTPLGNEAREFLKAAHQSVGFR